MDTPKNYLMDMDGVLVTGTNIVPGAEKFMARLRERHAKYLVLTNNPRYTPGDLAHRLQWIGLEIPSEHIFTSALATARFLHSQRPGGTAFVIGESGLTDAIHEVGYVITDHNPEYVVLGESDSIDFEQITKAIRLISGGAHFIATNPDPAGPAEDGMVPACGAMAALTERASGVSPFFVGKPNPLMMRLALNYLGTHSENTVMIGDRMDTDIVTGIESGMETVLVLTGVTRKEDVRRFPYQPTRIVGNIGEIEP
ncbi:Ribonucleotide monophosphatase NagD [Acidobacteriia bacterium SbA2]|nr:Ribonucleotide monophosphatase NagD [Acidobacteriia bacterium SbA2]